MQKHTVAMNFPIVFDSTVELTSKSAKEYRLIISKSDDMDRVHYGQAMDAIPQRLKCCCANSAQKMQQNPSLLPPYIESSWQ